MPLDPSSAGAAHPQRCPGCGGPVCLAFDLVDRSVYTCRRGDCTLHFAHPQPSDKALAAYYAQYYYGQGDPIYENSPEPYLRGLLAALQRRVGCLEGRHVLDFGCGIGTLAGLLLQAGATVDGVETDAQARATAGEHLGIRVVANLDELRADRVTYDLVTTMDVIEHVRSPREVLSDLGTLLRPGGWLFVSTPDAGALKARVRGVRWDNYQNPTHLYYFNARSLRRMLQALGFQEVAVWRPLVSYPAHGPARRLTQWGLQLSGLDGALHVLARPPALATSGVAGGTSRPA